MAKASALENRLNSALSRSIDSEWKVDYSFLETDKSVEEFASWLEEFDRKSLKSANEKITFWINAYNILVLHSVIKKLQKSPKYAETGNQSRFQRLSFLHKTKHKIGGKKYSFSQIEKVLRSAIDPRVHFTLCCASKSCPNLRKCLYTTENLDQELDDAARAFIRSPKGSELDKENKILRLSAIFDWFKKDFKIASGGVLSFIEKYLEKENRDFLKANHSEMKMDFLLYDWGLNIKKTSD